MNKVIYALLAIISLASCANSYNIEGSSNIPTLDGRMLFLKTYNNGDLRDIDSCDIVHGKFAFKGTLDSTKLVTLFMDEESIIPVVLEKGDISIKIDNTQRRVSGTPLNEKLFNFLEQYDQLANEMADLSHIQSQAIMEGADLNEINAKLNQMADEISDKEDKLITSFIVDNFDNVLGPGVFFMVTATNTYPELSPWIEDIMSKATANFKNDPYVKDYYEKAQQNQAIMNGTAFANDANDYNSPQAQTPTPNELAQPNDTLNSQGLLP
ncbi:MAG: DUF4369 domain-containing protein [Prevotella sp.]|nr:DUF4369 domain-containing protein [Prevotella sp.]